MAQVRVENLNKSFDQFTAVHDSSFTIEDGTFFALLGPSGCGKTTTLRMIAGLELPTDGRILLDGEDVTFRRAAARDIAFVFQLFALYPHMNVAQNIGFPLKCQGMDRREARDRVVETARLLRIEHLLTSKTSKIVRRRPAARRARARHGAPAEGVPDGRAARSARRGVSPAHVRRVARTSRPDFRDHDLCYPRSARSDVDGGSHRDHERRQGRADRYAPGSVRPAGEHVRRGFHRFAADELHAVRERARKPATVRSKLDGVSVPVPEICEQRAAGPLVLGVRPSTSGFRTRRRCAAVSSAPNISAPPRS